MIPSLFDRIRRHDGLITDLRQANPAWFTRTLYRNGHLERGKVIAVHRERWRKTNLSILWHLRINYSSGASPSAPTRLLLKFTKPEISPKRPSILGRKEVEFYAVIADAMNAPPVPRCYDAIYSPESGKSHILMEDLSETHFQPKHPLPPSRLACEQNIECLARFHSHWWNDPRLGHSIGRIRTDEQIQKRATEVEKQVVDFMRMLDDILSVKRRRIYQEVIGFYPKLLQLQRDGNVTLTHGDAHVWNFMNPRHPDQAVTRIIDWEFWRVDAGTNDLAFMIALHWFPERRVALEQELLKSYYDVLESSENKSLTWENCWTSYRLSVIKQLLTPVYQWGNGLRPRTWWPNLERVMIAFDDLQCAELLE